MHIKKAILTGGGRATRLRPITNTINKHLIPVANKPMIFYAIEKAVAAGIEEIFININPEEIQLQQAIGDGGHWGIKIKFFVQEGGPQGIAHVVKCAEHFIGNDPFMFYLSDNIILGSLEPFFNEFNKNQPHCLLAFAKVPDPERFGVPVFDTNNTLIDVLEKPSNPPNNLAQTGIYLYGPKVFFEAFNNIKKSARGEYEISSIHSYFLKQGYKVNHLEVTGWWKDTGKPEDLIIANELAMDDIKPSSFTHEGLVGENSKIIGNVHIGVGTTVGPNVTLVGPVIIGENCSLENCSVGPYVTLSTGTTIKNATVRHSIILGNCVITAPITIEQSIIGERSTISGTTPNSAPSRFLLGDHTLLQL